MKRFLIVSLPLFVASQFTGCAAMRAGLANASAQHIRGCAPEELEVSNTSGANPFTGPSWHAICHGEEYVCSGYMQVASTVRCAPVRSSTGS